MKHKKKKMFDIHLLCCLHQTITFIITLIYKNDVIKFCNTFNICL